MTRYLILAALAVITPARRGLSYVEGRLARAEYQLRAGTGALFIALAALALGGCDGNVQEYSAAAVVVGATLVLARRALDVVRRLAIGVLLVVSLAGCHSQAPARTALNAAAEALHAVDASVTVVYVARSATALEAAPDLDAYRERMAPLERAHDAIVGAAAALLAAQAVLDGADSRSFGHGFRCTLDALEVVRVALVEIGIEVPSEVGRALTFLSALAVGECPPEPRR